MGTQKTGGSFRLASQLRPLMNLRDFSAPSGTPVWTLGATQIDQIQLQVPAGHIWELLGYSITTFLQLEVLAARAFGKFGKIWGGLVPNGQPTGFPSNPYIGYPPVPPLPQDASLLVPLWDPDVDPLPPVSASAVTPTGNLLPITKNVQLPQPLETRLGDQIGIGIWMSPSLMGNFSGGVNSFSLVVCSSSYTLVYDDGKARPAWV